jgi:hypothetical protein
MCWFMGLFPVEVRWAPIVKMGWAADDSWGFHICVVSIVTCWGDLVESGCVGTATFPIAADRGMRE